MEACQKILLWSKSSNLNFHLVLKMMMCTSFYIALKKLTINNIKKTFVDESIEKFKTIHKQKKHLVLLLRSEESVIMTIIFQFFKMTKKSNLKRLSFFTIPNSFFCNRAKKFEKTVLSYCHARCHQLWP